MSLLKKLLSDTALYGVSSILGRTLNYFLVILHTAVFSSEDFGIQSELYVYVAFLQIIYLYGMETAFFRYCQKYTLARAYHLAFSSILLTTLVLTFIFLSYSTLFAELLGYPDKAYIIRYLAYILAIDAILAIPFAKLRQEKKAKIFAFTKIINIFLVIFFNLFFLFFCKNIYENTFLPSLKPHIVLIYSPEIGIGYIFLANLLANLLQIPLLYKPLSEVHFVWRWKELKPMLIFAYPLIFTGLAGMVNNMIDRIMLKYYLPNNFYAGKNSLQAMGIYAACLKLSIFMSLAVQAFRYSAEPFFFAQANDKNAPALFAKVMRYFVIICCLIYVVVSVNLDILGYIFLRKPEYREGIGVVPLLLLGNLFLGIYFNLSAWFKITEKTYFGTYFSLIGAIFTIVANWITIPIAGYWGSASSFLVVSILMVILGYSYGQKYFPIPYQIGHGFLHILVASILVAITWLIKLPNFWANFALHQGLWLLYFAGILLTEYKKFTITKK